MALDFYVKDDSRDPAPFVQLYLDDHSDLVTVARELNLRLFLRFENYYGEEGEIEERELEEFINELTRLGAAASSEDQH